jgi:hypothetical protein
LRELGRGSVLFCQRHLDVDGGENGEDVCLQCRDEDLEQREGKTKCESTDTEKTDRVALCKHGEEEELSRRETQHEQHVPGDHVHEKSESQRDRTKNERRQELEQRNDRRNKDRNAWQDERVLEEAADAVTLDSRVDEKHVDENGHDERNTDNRGTCDLQTRYYSGDIHAESGEEDGHQHRQEPLALFFAKSADGDAVTDESGDELNDNLGARGNDAHATRAEPEQANDEHDNEQTDEHDAVELERRADEQDGRREEIVG